MAPELAIVLPGTTLVCGDSHTCTNGGVGALAFGIGASELSHALATQTLMQRRPRTMRIRFEGTLPPGVTAKDMILHAIGRLGTAAGTGHAVEYAGAAVRALPLEARLTLCNLSIELGAKMGMVAPDDTTFAYLAGRRFAPKGAAWEAALADWRRLPGDPDAPFDAGPPHRGGGDRPAGHLGQQPGAGAAHHRQHPRAGHRRRSRRAGLYGPGSRPRRSPGTRVDWVFIGSCTNSRLSDLRDAAAVLRGRHVAPHVTAWVVPGSETVKREAEAEGLHRAFLAAGFEWREPGCSLCVAANGETVPPGARSVSTSNRNFVGRQGTGSRTHLASPAMAAAAALAGEITDLRRSDAALHHRHRPGAPLIWANVDTDMIIPVQRLVGASRTGLGPLGFERFRYQADGRDNPDFPLNRPPSAARRSCSPGENFGCGSSREGAVWALMGMGVRCVIAPSFGDIFHNNCFQNGLLPVRLPAALIRRIAEATEASPGNARTTVDLDRPGGGHALGGGGALRHRCAEEDRAARGAG